MSRLQLADRQLECERRAGHERHVLRELVQSATARVGRAERRVLRCHVQVVYDVERRVCVVCSGRNQYARNVSRDGDEPSGGDSRHVTVAEHRAQVFFSTHGRSAAR
jgi:hypothetical protein